MRLFPVSITLSVFVGVAGLFAQGQTTEPKEPPGSQVKGVPPRTAATDYQAQAKAGDVTIAADFLGHAIPRMEGPLMTEDYVVVEAGLFGPPGKQITLSIGNFSLRINGKKALPSAPSELVAKSVKDPQWSPPAPPTKSKSGFGSGGQNEPPPVPPRMPFEMRRALAQHLQRTSMPLGEHALPQAGLLYFQHRGKRENIRSVELTYASDAGKATLTLQP